MASENRARSESVLVAYLCLLKTNRTRSSVSRRPSQQQYIHSNTYSGLLASYNALFVSPVPIAGAQPPCLRGLLPFLLAFLGGEAVVLFDIAGHARPSASYRPCSQSLQPPLTRIPTDSRAYPRAEIHSASRRRGSRR